jgi:DNA repair photolyase
MEKEILAAKGVKNIVVKIPSPMQFICKSEGFNKKGLATHKIDLLKECGLNCSYCTTLFGQGVSYKVPIFMQAIEDQYPGKGYTIHTPGLTIEYYNLMSALHKEMQSYDKSFGEGKVLMFSQLTDAFSPRLVKLGHTREALDMILEKTSFRIRVLTKNAIVGDDEWLEYFDRNRHRFIVGLSTGNMDDMWTRKVERGTSPPTNRFKALKNLQDAGIPTFAMLCPIFENVVKEGRVGELIDKINPDIVENIWAEPVNSHTGGIWKKVRAGFRKDSEEYKWLTEAYENKNTQLITQYHTDLYSQLLDHAVENEWVDKFIYLLYEAYITEHDVETFRGLVGVNSQSNKSDSGLSNNEVIAKLQKEVE